MAGLGERVYQRAGNHARKPPGNAGREESDAAGRGGVFGAARVSRRGGVLALHCTQGEEFWPFTVHKVGCP